MICALSPEGTYALSYSVYRVSSLNLSTYSLSRPIHTDKDKWIHAERDRWARYFNVPTVTNPPKFPAMTLTVMRAICAVAHCTGQPQTSSAGQKAIIGAVDAFYEAYWGQARDITDKEVVQDVLGKVVGAGEVGKVLEVTGNEGKKMLLENTEEAFKEGAFGLPWMVCENDRGEKEGFWGVDHLGCVLDFLGIEKPNKGPWRALL